MRLAQPGPLAFLAESNAMARGFAKTFGCGDRVHIANGHWRRYLAAELRFSDLGAFRAEGSALLRRLPQRLNLAIGIGMRAERRLHDRLSHCLRHLGTRTHFAEWGSVVRSLPQCIGQPCR